MKKIVYTIVLLMLAILTGAVVHGSAKDKRQKEVIRCAPLKQAIVKATVKTTNSDLLLPSPFLL